MMPILFDEFEVEYCSNGVGILNDSIICEVTQELNGQFELVMRYPIAGIHFSELRQRRIILAKAAPNGKTQPFRIYRITKPMGGIVTVYARHIAYDLAGIPVSPFEASGVRDAFFLMPQKAVVECPFRFATDKTNDAPFRVDVPKEIWNLLGGSQGSILDVYGGEYIFDRFNVNLVQRRGVDTGVTVRYGKNLKNIEQDECCANCYTGVYPYWTDEEGNFVELPEKNVEAPGKYSYVRLRTVDLSAEWQERPTHEQLRDRAERFVSENQIGVPKISWKIEFLQHTQSEGCYDLSTLETVDIGDTVSVYFTEMEINATSRVVAVTFDSLLEKYKSLSLGSVKANIAQTIASQQVTIAQKASLTTVERITMALTGRLMGALGGNVRLLDEDGDGLPDTIYIGDSADLNQAKKVWRWNYEGWAASSTGYNGEFKLGATLEDGILAHAVTAANLIAGSIKSADNKTFFLDLDNGILRMAAETLSIKGKTVEQIAEERVKIAVEGQTQEAIFNILSNNGKYDGIWMEDGKLYFNLTYAQSGFLSAENIKLSGKFTVYSDMESDVTGGYMGYMAGSSTGINKTDGIGMSNENETAYVIVTTKGLRLQAGSIDLNIPIGGPVNINSDLVVNGNIRYSGSLNNNV